jgi:hypothetical protein
MLRRCFSCVGLPAVGNQIDATLMYQAGFQVRLFHSIVWIYVLLDPAPGLAVANDSSSSRGDP